MRRALAPLAGAGILMACSAPNLPTDSRRSDPVPAAITTPALASTAPSTKPPPSPAPALRIEAGLYRCDSDRTVLIRRVSPDARQLTLQWQGIDQVLSAVDALNGALRYEGPTPGLIWIQIAGRSTLLDSRLGRQLASECRL